MGRKVTYSVNLEAHSDLPIQFQPPRPRVLDLQTDTTVEAKILDLLDRDSPRSNTGGLALGSAHDIP